MEDKESKEIRNTKKIWIWSEIDSGFIDPRTIFRIKSFLINWTKVNIRKQRKKEKEN